MHKHGTTTSMYLDIVMTSTCLETPQQEANFTVSIIDPMALVDAAVLLSAQSSYCNENCLWNGGVLGQSLQKAA